jgi:phosphoribosylamine--glycine ligase
VKVTDVEGLVALAQEIAADLVVVGPESALEVGLADRLAELNIPCFGGSQRAARLETSKAFTKDFCQRHGLPTAAYGVFTDAASAGAFLDTLDAPFVIKADGLAAGKGVVIAADRAEADAAVLDMLGGRFGSAGARVVIEEFMHGEEASLFAICDGKTAMLFGAAQDHKRAYDGDEGPNTGGMGTYSPPPVLTDALVDQAWRELIEPTVKGMAAEGNPYVGVLYAGLMLTPTGPQAGRIQRPLRRPRMPDPDAAPGERPRADPAGRRQGRAGVGRPPVWREEAAICVVLAAEGYPDAPKTGGLIQGADADFGGEAWSSTPARPASSRAAWWRPAAGC